jgi:hypothetical protein
MKRKLIAAALVALWCGSLRSSGSNSVDIVLSIEQLDVSLVEGTLDISVDVQNNIVKPRAVVRNTGNVNEDYRVRISSQSQPPNWNLIITTAALGHNEYRLRALWHKNDEAPVSSEYLANDILSTTAVTSTGSRFFNESDTHTVSGFHGYDVSPGQYSNLYIWVEGPPAGSNSGPLTATVSVTAIATP